MRRLTLPALPVEKTRRTAIWPAAVVGSIALSLVGEHAAEASTPIVPAPLLPPTDSIEPRASLAAVRASAPAAQTYVVQAGDTVWGIARAHGLDTATVRAANGIGADNVIRPGQVLALTAGTSASAPASESAPAGVTHDVRPGDTVSAIASRNGVSIEAVLAANDLSRASIIYPGQVLQIPAAGPAPAAVAPTTAPGLDAEQSDNARLIIRIGRELGVSDRGIVIALGTAMQESWLRNLDWGDRDSLGLFQQRPSTGWGSPEQILDRDRATRVFYGGRSDPNGTATHGLLDIPDWDRLPFADAAQAVQISAYPDRYAQWEQPATMWLAVLG